MQKKSTITPEPPAQTALTADAGFSFANVAKSAVSSVALQPDDFEDRLDKDALSDLNLPFYILKVSELLEGKQANQRFYIITAGLQDGSVGTFILASNTQRDAIAQSYYDTQRPSGPWTINRMELKSGNTFYRLHAVSTAELMVMETTIPF